MENYDRWSVDLALLRGNARRIIVRDMGNGVDRVDGLVFVPVQEALASGFDGRCAALLLPSPARMTDLMGWRGDELDPGWLLPVGFARMTDDGEMELTGWLALLVGSIPQCNPLAA